MLPLNLRPDRCRCLVVGGGAVGQRKARMLLEAGAKVRLVCLEPRQEFPTPQQPEWLQAAYQPPHLEGMNLAVAAATTAVNRRVASDAQERGIWVNVADDPAASDFHFPAVHRQGSLLLTVSTGGASPLLAQQLRDALAVQFDSAYAVWLSLLDELRPQVLLLPLDKRRAILQKLIDPDWLERLRYESVAVVRHAMLTLFQNFRTSSNSP